MIEIAKYQLDIGLFTNREDDLLSFWQALPGVRFDSDLPLGAGLLQRRHEFRGSVIKINHNRTPLPAGASGYDRLLLADPSVDSPRVAVDPDGNRVTRVPPGYRGITQLGLEICCRDLAESRRFWGGTLGLPPAPRGGPDAFQFGDSVLLLQASEQAPAHTGALEALGFRYVTLQVWDCDAVHRSLCAAGAEEAAPPRTLGDVARIAFVRDPGGNWIELSQRASLTGPLG